MTLHPVAQPKPRRLLANKMNLPKTAMIVIRGIQAKARVQRLKQSRQSRVHAKDFSLLYN
jgi:uncharacterized protein YhbP (UPF0306 family)